jgi:acetyl esterase/lipase
VQRVVRWVRANAAMSNVDPDRIGAYGHYAGAHRASMLGARDTRDDSDPTLAGISSRVSCVVALAGHFDLTIP